MLKMGMTGQEVSDLQRALGTVGHFCIIDGDFGVQTMLAVSAFQHDAGLDMDGVYGPLTESRLTSRIIELDSKHEDYDIPPVATPWMNWMISNIGQHEVAGPKANPFIIDLFRYTSMRNSKGSLIDETPWCAACVCAALEKNGYKSPNSAWVGNFDHYGQILKEPKYGAIVNLGYHITFYFGPGPTGYYNCLGGNQADSVKFSNFPIRDVKSIHWPEKR